MWTKYEFNSTTLCNKIRWKSVQCLCDVAPTPVDPQSWIQSPCRPWTCWSGGPGPCPRSSGSPCPCWLQSCSCPSSMFRSLYENRGYFLSMLSKSYERKRCVTEREGDRQITYGSSRLGPLGPQFQLNGELPDELSEEILICIFGELVENKPIRDLALG